jgi:hypothetical protein
MRNSDLNFGLIQMKKKKKKFGKQIFLICEGVLLVYGGRWWGFVDTIFISCQHDDAPPSLLCGNNGGAQGGPRWL